MNAPTTTRVPLDEVATWAANERCELQVKAGDSWGTVAQWVARNEAAWHFAATGGARLQCADPSVQLRIVRMHSVNCHVLRGNGWRAELLKSPWSG